MSSHSGNFVLIYMLAFLLSFILKYKLAANKKILELIVYGKKATGRARVSFPALFTSRKYLTHPLCGSQLGHSHWAVASLCKAFSHPIKLIPVCLCVY